MVYFRPSEIVGEIDVSGSVNLSRLDIILHAEVTAISASTLTTILTRTSLALENIVLMTVSGQASAKYEFFIDTVLKGTKRTGAGKGNDAEWNFAFPLALDITQVLDIKVTHFHTGGSLDFQASLYAFTSA